MEYSLKHIIRKPKIEVSNPALLLMLHGYGSNEHDLFSFAHELPDELLVISVQAPLSLIFGGYAWYSINFEASDASKRVNINEATEARVLLEKFIDEIQNTYHYDKDKSILMGFSQGAILSYAMALSFPDKIKNIIALSGYIDENIIIVPDDTSGYSKLDLFCSHGSVDPIIPVEWARKAPKYLQNLNIKHEYKEYHEGHGVAHLNFVDFKNWIIDKLKT